MTFLMTFLSIGGEATYMAYGGDARMQVLMMEKLSKGLSFIFISIYWLVMMVGGSMVFRNMRTKQQRIAYMMLPASNMEKYVTRVVMVALGGLLMSVVSFVLADQLQMVFIKLIFGDTHIGSYVMASASMLSDIASKGVGALKSMGIDIETSFPNSSLYTSFAATGMQSGNFLGVWFRHVCLSPYGLAVPPPFVVVRMPYILFGYSVDTSHCPGCEHLDTGYADARVHCGVRVAFLPCVHKDAGNKQ